MRTLTSVLLLLFLSAPLAAQRIDAVPHTLPVVELQAATLDELARTVVSEPLVGRHDERPRPVSHVAAKTTINPIVAEFVTAPAAAPLPAVTRGFRSSFDPLPAALTYYYPPDASGAVGPSHAVGVFNNSFAVHDRNGNQLSFLSIYQFWANPGGPQIGSAVYDPRVLYDAPNDRFVIAMLTDTNEMQGALLLAVTATGDPTGTWRRFRIGVSQDPSVDPDFTRMAMTADQIVITANEFSGSGDEWTDVFTIPKSTAYSLTSTPQVTKTPSHAYVDLTPVSSGDTTVRILSQDFGGTITQLVLASGQLGAVADYLPPAGFYLGPPDCQQLGTTKDMDCGVAMLHYALFRDGVLWVVERANATNNVIVVWKIGQTAKGILISDPKTDYAYPSIAVNRLGAALVGYSTFNASMYPSSECRYIDPAGNVSAPLTVKSGEDWWGNWRWGDYSTTQVDPVDDTSFWTLQSYSMPPFKGQHISWGTWWSRVEVRAPRVRAVRHP